MKLYQKQIRGQETKIYPLFVVLIGNAKITEKIVFNLESPVIKYHQKLSNSWCLSSLVSTFHGMCDNRAAYARENCIK